MEEFKGTQGKWLVSRSDIDSSGRSCHRLNTNGRPTTQEVDANKKLIESAPELLKALQGLIHLHCCEMEGISSGMPTPNQWVDAVNYGSEIVFKALSNEG